jgi:hypothetical protein
MPDRLKSPFLESVRDLIRVKHLSYRTAELTRAKPPNESEI